MNIKENKEKKLALKDYAHGIKLIWQQITVNHKREVRTLVILSFFIAILDGIVPLISGHFFDAITNISTDIGSVWFALILLLVVTAFSAIGQKIKVTKSDWVNYKIITTYHSDVAAKFVKLPVSYLKNHPMSEMVQKTMTAGNNLQSMFSDVIMELLPAFLGIIVAFVTVLR
ncbi:ABC transporter ATP-binding protein [Candidatus Nomurabacteria bacterium]|nr:MAG: ABC transporter ATP-binding protein [Candidatus Nomurabacteria bacterium]